MRVVLAPAAFAGELSAGQVASAMAQGWGRAAPHDEVVVAPLSDGGLGFVEVVHAARGGDLLPVTVEGPLGGVVPGAVLLVNGADGAGGVGGDPTTAYVEAAEAAGRHLLPAGSLAATTATSYGVGQLIQAAVDTGARRIVVGVGGTGTNDGGAGLLAALGAGPRADLAAGGLALAGLDPAALTGLAEARASLSGVELVLASATDVALLGFHGTSATYAEGKGATPEQAQQLEAALGHYADLASRALVAGRSLMGRGLAGEPGSGAGGGIGFALLLLGARHVDGVQAVVAATGLPELVAGSELVVTAEGTFDWESLRGGVVAAVATLGLSAGVPCIVLAAEVLVGRRESMTLGLAGTYAIAERPGDRLTAMQDPTAAIQARSARIARTWSRP